MNEALKNRFVVIHVDYIDGDILKNVIKEQSLLQDDKQIEQIIKFDEDYVLCLSRDKFLKKPLVSVHY